MKDFKTFFEDFNNWKNPVNANNSGPDIVDFRGSDSAPSGFKGAQGLTWQGASQQVDLKIPTKSKRKKTLKQLKAQLKQLRAKLDKLK